jgi:hypothetical protein
MVKPYSSIKREVTPVEKKYAGQPYLPPTHLHCFKHHLSLTGRDNITERDKKLLKYIRCLQESRSNAGLLNIFCGVMPGKRKLSQIP